MINLPKKCIVNKFLSKKLFCDKVKISINVKNDLKNLVERITWLYKLSPDTIGITKTNKVEEIQIFQLDIRDKKLPISIINMITKSIPYKILFIIKYKKEYCYATKVEEIYFSNWNEDVKFNFNAINLEILYENIVKSIIKEKDNNQKFDNILKNKITLKKLDKQISILTKKVQSEKQFNRKVELNIELNKLKQEMEELLNE